MQEHAYQDISWWRRRTTVTVVGGLLVVLLVLAMGVAWNPALRARVVGVRLERRYAVGGVVRQRLRATWNGRHFVRGLPPALGARLQATDGREVLARLDMVTRQVVKSVGADGGAILEETVESGTVGIGGWQTRVGRGRPSTVKVDARGRLVDAGEGGALTAEQRARWSDTLSVLASGYLGGELRRVGQSWSRPLEMSLEDEGIAMRTRGKIDYSLEGVERQAEGAVVVLSAEQGLDVAISPGGQAAGSSPLEVTGHFSGSTRILLGHEDGMVRRQEGRGEARLTFRALLPPSIVGRGRRAKVEGRATGTVVYTLETLPSGEPRP